ncbi:MAG: tetratricopeptide repeat protein [Myxococcales bacterium]|nr:tetratricopeptide repeat protein [Myxococcales bacterium]
MRALLAVGLLLLATPDAGRARELVAAKSWEELYLAFSASGPAGRSAAERKEIASALLAGCRALAKADPVMAFSLGDRAAAFHESEPALLCLSRAAVASGQRGEAERALKRGVERYSQSGELWLALGKLLLEEGDAKGAERALRRVPRRSPQGREAHSMLSRARAEVAKQAQAISQARSHEAEVRRREEAAGEGAGFSSYQSAEGPEGLRVRANQRFRIAYLGRKRDFGQRAEYEGKVVAALEEAHEAARRVLGAVRDSPVEVVLYRKEEFAARFGEHRAKRLAGLYLEGAIHLNDAVEIDAEQRATLVHEYVHATMDEHGGEGRMPTWLSEGLAEYVEWRYQGREHPSKDLGAELRERARAGRLVRLAELASLPSTEVPEPELAWAVSAEAVRRMLDDGGAARMMDLVRGLAAGEPFDEAFERRYGRTVSDLDDELRVGLSRP